MKELPSKISTYKGDGYIFVTRDKIQAFCNIWCVLIKYISTLLFISTVYGACILYHSVYGVELQRQITR